MTEDTTRLIINSDVFFPLVKELLDENIDVKFTVTGISMQPLIRDNRDQVILTALSRPLKKGDIVLVESPYNKSRYILHRITKLSGEMIQTTGDGCLTRDAPVKKSCIIAVARAVIRKERYIDCNKPSWRMLFFLWSALFPVRAFLLDILNKRT